VFFHGTLWPERSLLFDAIAAEMPDVAVRVSGIDITGQYSDDSLINNDELARMYGGATICLNHHRTFSEPGEHIVTGAAYSIGPRAYEIAACGAFQLCDDTRPELREIFGRGVPTYTDADDLVARIKHFMGRPHKRKLLAELARKRVQGCTFERRAQEFVEPILRGL